MRTFAKLASVITLLIPSSLELFASATPTLANFNRVYFLVDTLPTAVVTNVILLSGNLTNWQKLGTNIVIPINPTSGYLSMNSGGSFADAPFRTNGTTLIYNAGSDQIAFGPDPVNAAQGMIWNPANYLTIGDQTNTSTLHVFGKSTMDTYIGASGITVQAGNNTTDPFGGNRLEATTTATASHGNQKNSPDLILRGSGWDVDDATSRYLYFSFRDEPIEGNDVTGTLILRSVVFGIGGAMGTTNFTVSSVSGWGGLGTKALTDDGTYKTFGTGSASVNPTSTFLPYNNAGAFADSRIYHDAANDGLVVITNATQTIAAKFGASGNLAVIRGPSGVGLTDGLLSGNELRWFQNSLFPVQTNTVLGAGPSLSPRFEFGALNAWSNVIHGFYDSTGTNYIKRVDHFSETNTVFDIQSKTNNVNGPVGNFQFRTNDVTVYTIPGGVIWDDSMVPEALVRVGATAPVQANFNGGPGQTLQFQNNRDDAVLASVQLSHRYKQGTSVYPHVHWSEVATTGAGTNVVWELQYSWQNPGVGVYPPYATLLMTNNVTGTNWWHSMSSFPAISGAGRTVSAVMVFQLRRLANSAAADDYDQNVAFLGFDLHYQVDSPGSDNAVSKSF